MSPTQELKPMGLLPSALYMGIPGLLMVVLMRFVAPHALEAGMSQLVAFWMSIYVPCLLAGVIAVVAYRRDGYPMTWSAFAQRMRLGQMPGAHWAIAFGLTVTVVLLENSVLEPLAGFLARQDLFAPPDWLGAPIHPLKEWEVTTFLGTDLAGQWWVLLAYLPCWCCNIFGEELLWRGYMLPRQELAFGRWAWLVNGVFWIVLFHLAMPWIWLAILPSLVLVPLSAQWSGSTWMPIAIHGIGNGLIFPLFLWAVIA